MQFDYKIIHIREKIRNRKVFHFKMLRPLKSSINLILYCPNFRYTVQTYFVWENMQPCK